ncbi:MAG: exosortase [Candidatus Omnitrophica bacterium]|nr:exosortase [Candidatus Omnitrophota bacterium]
MNGDINVIKEISLKYRTQVGISVIFLLTYVPTFLWMWDRWFARDSYYSHGILIPFVTGFLIWQKRDELKNTSVVESPWGMRLIILGMVVHVISAVFRIYFSSGFSMLIVLCGLVLHFWGKEIFKKILFPLAFLIFMVPLPMVIITNLSFRLKLFAADIAALVLNNMGVPAIQEGSIIKMRHTHVIVDDVCSGLRSLISLTALGSIFAYWLKVPIISLAAGGSVIAYWMKSPATRKIFLFLMTIPIAIITNVCRVLILSLISEIYGAEYASGFVHDATGFMVFALAFILLWATSRLIE